HGSSRRPEDNAGSHRKWPHHRRAISLFRLPRRGTCCLPAAVQLPPSRRVTRCTPDAHAHPLRAAVGFAPVPPNEPKLPLLQSWVDTWRGMGDVVRGVKWQAWNLGLGPGQGIPEGLLSLKPLSSMRPRRSAKGTRRSTSRICMSNTLVLTRAWIRGRRRLSQGCGADESEGT